MSLNLSSIISILPCSRLFSLMTGKNWFDASLTLDFTTVPTAGLFGVYAMRTSKVDGDVEEQLQLEHLPPLPGLWEFLTSGYLLGLFIMVCCM